MQKVINYSLPAACCVWPQFFLTQLNILKANQCYQYAKHDNYLALHKKKKRVEKNLVNTKKE